MGFTAEYGLFLAKSVTVLVVIVALVLFIVNQRGKTKQSPGELLIREPGKEFEQLQKRLELALVEPSAQKQWRKTEKQNEKARIKERKAEAKAGTTPTKPVLYLLNFKGSMDAHEVETLRKEVSAVLSVAKPGDEVLLKLESPGGVVHGYGLAASQLQRIRDQGITLTAVVDKVAASGGYMMACVANHIVAAPFSIIGSIGVVAQIPNIHRLLKKNDIDVELHTAGQYKRTLTMLGENSEEGREKFRQDLDETHQLFKSFVAQMRPSLDINSVATGEHWYGKQALEKGLIDEISTSDALIISKMQQFRLLSISYAHRKTLVERFTQSGASVVEKAVLKLWQRGQKPLL
ncbi:protease SohB [Rosenbergiella epipactidis]|uniref:protease SohB n=1 Tax=Rosenbergiella epipactidis TaxID=1544694 RepID=UPI00066473C3|nr:peptidase [bacteria symbiont BFo2 of Frankliniella occidentalis]KYP93472.1 peptidase [bacteria symbiont BFo2 of Frankliniella occidentalis]KYP94495.1 peptidase [bacteria symbiont BFo2 of Frankliniella occidentalis]